MSRPRGGRIGLRGRVDLAAAGRPAASASAGAGGRVGGPAGEGIARRHVLIAVQSQRVEHLAGLGGRLGRRGVAFPFQVAAGLLRRVAHVEARCTAPRGLRPGKSATRPRQDRFRPSPDARVAAGRPFAAGLSADGSPGRGRLPHHGHAKPRLAGRAAMGPAAAILAERTIAKAIQPTSAFAVVFNRTLLVRLTGVVPAIFRPPDIEEGRPLDQVLKIRSMRAG